MDEDEDDLYGNIAEIGTGAADQSSASNGHTSGAPSQRDLEDGAQQDEADEEGDEDADSDSDIEIVTERPPGAPAPEPSKAPTRLDALKSQSNHARSPSDSKGPSTPQKSTSKSQASPSTPLKPGHEYPEVHTSTLDLTANPPLTGTDKPITDIDIDADLAEHDKPWRRPGSDQADYFNYGFDEFSWATYCLKQKTMRDAIGEQAASTANFQNMLGGGAGPGPGMMGAQQMPDMDQGMMQAMAQQMMQQGVDPSQMDFGSFMQSMQTMQGGGGGNFPTGPAAQGGQGQFGGMMDGGASVHRNQGNFVGRGRRGGRW